MYNFDMLNLKKKIGHKLKKGKFKILLKINKNLIMCYKIYKICVYEFDIKQKFI